LKETVMENPRTESARRHDDSDLIDAMEDAPSQSGAKGGNLQRDIASRAEEEHTAGDADGVTRVHASDKPHEANLPRYNQR
jgi:hypothetical protein